MLAISLTGEHVYLTRGGSAGSRLALPPLPGGGRAPRCFRSANTNPGALVRQGIRNCRVRPRGSWRQRPAGAVTAHERE